MRIIESNPYRYLGVYSNSPTKERVANLAKINAFLKVDKQVEFPLDLSNLLGTIKRTNKTITDAVAKLTLPVDLIKYAQFWWMKVTPGDEEALSHLLKGEVTEAKEIWEKLEDISSLQNRIVLSLIEGDFSTAICFAEKLYDTYALSFISFIINDGSPITNVTLSHNFIDVLMNEGVNMLNFQNYVTNNNWKKYVSDKTTEPLINSINQVIAVAKSSRGQNYNDRYEAGQTLMESTKGTLDKLKSIIPMTDLRYETIADKLGLEILQCGIDYYNSSNDNDRAQRTQKMIQGALSIVVGNLAKQRCQDQANNIEKIIAQQPPIEVMAQYNQIIIKLRKYKLMPIKIEYATALLKDTQPILRQMRTILGISHDLYLRMSTLVLNYALNNVVEEVRNMQEGGTFADVSDILSKRSKEKSLLKCAWSAMKLMDKFDMDASFRKNRYDENLIALRSICKYYEVSTPCSKLMKKSLSKSAKNNSSSFKNNLWAYFMVCVIRVLQFAGLGLLGGIVCAIFSDNKIHTFFEMWGSLTAIGAFFAVLAIIIALIKDAFSWIKGRLNW